MNVYNTSGAHCTQCLNLNGKPLSSEAGNIGKVLMGHQMYHTHDGISAACILGAAKE